ncbi:MAG TPA: FxSxx-COOH system tetratricopeptide repeat protein [Ktedonobacteraceae bacterium]
MRDSPLDIFCAYAPEDEYWYQKLNTHLSLLQRLEQISTWSANQAVAGSDWVEEINAHLKRAAIILLLISPDFLASDFCYSAEMQDALERQRMGATQVIPLLVRPVDWQGAPFAHLQVLPTQARFLATWENEDLAFASVVESLRQVLAGQPLQADPLQQRQITWNIPARRNPYFVGRAEILERIHQAFASSDSDRSQPQALYGLPGIGKTQVSLEYIYRYQSEYEKIFWVKADSPERLTADLVSLAYPLHLPEKEQQEEKIVLAAVALWLNTHTNWLLVFDNADDLQYLEKFLPTQNTGHILITTQTPPARRSMKRLVLEKMSSQTGMLLLLQRANLLLPEQQLEHVSTAEIALVEKLVELMDGHPLALDQAGAYIEEMGCRLSEYLSLYQKHQTELLNEHGGLGALFKLSLQKVKNAHTEASHLLKFLAFFHPDAIPEEIFTPGASYLGPLQAKISDQYQWNKLISPLLKYSLISRDTAKKTLRMHRLLQAFLKNEMSEEAQMRWSLRAIQAVSHLFARPTSEEAERYWLYISHVYECEALIWQREIVSWEAIELLVRAGSYLRQNASYAEAEPIVKHALNLLYQDSANPNFQAVVYSLRAQAVGYMRQARHAEAEPLLLRAVVICERMLGPEHLDTARNREYLAMVYDEQGRYVEAERLQRQVLTVREKALGEKYPITARALHHLANICWHLGKYTEAEALHQRALTIREDVLGPEHTDTGISLGSLGNTYRSLGRDIEAEPLLKRALAIHRQELGLEHPDTATSMSNLASLNESLGKYAEAERLYQRVLAIREHALGQEHPDTATSLNNLASLYHSQGKYLEAEPLYLRALAVKERIWGPEHPDTALCLNNLANLYEGQGKYVEAEPLYQRALAIRERVMGAEHPDTAASLNNLANLYTNQGKYVEAEPLCQRALAIRERVQGADHPDTATSLNNLANLYHAQGKYVEAEPLYQRALAIHERVQGANHLATATTLNNLANLYTNQEGKYVEAEPLYQRALAIHERIQGADHPKTALVLNNLAGLYKDLGKYVEAEQLSIRALTIYEQARQIESPEALSSLNNLASLYERKGNTLEAEQLYKRALTIRERISGPEHPETANCLNNLATLYAHQGRYEEAELSYQRAQLICEKVLGKDHPHTRLVQANYAQMLESITPDTHD